MAIALALPVWAQRQASQGSYSAHSGGGSAHYGGMGHGGPAGRGGFAGYTRAPSYAGLYGLQNPSSFSPPGRFPMPGGLEPPARAGSSVTYGGNGFSGGSFYQRPGYPGRNPHRGPYRGHDHDRHHRGAWGGGYGYAPGYVYPYPYVVDPGFYDWGATDYSENEQQGSNADIPPGQGPDYGPDAPPSGYADTYPAQQVNPEPPSPAPATRQEYHFAATSPSNPAPVASKPLTVIFKGSRAPEKIQNYMVNSSSLTNLDSDHFEKIPLDQIDVAATQQANRSTGIDFQVPVATRD